MYGGRCPNVAVLKIHFALHMLRQKALNYYMLIAYLMCHILALSSHPALQIGAGFAGLSLRKCFKATRSPFDVRKMERL